MTEEENDPVRLVDDPSTPPALRKALREMRAEPAVDFDVERGLARLHAAMKAEGLEGAPSAAPTPAPAAPAKVVPLRPRTARMAGWVMSLAAVLLLLAFAWQFRPQDNTGAPPARDASEATQMEKLRRDLSGDAAALLAEADALTVRFGQSGVLYEEREALAIDALVRLKRDEEARPRARAFLQRFPGSRFAPQVSALWGLAGP